MNCENQHNLIRYHYGELEPAEAARFESHLRTCAGCRQELEDLKALGSELNRAFEGARVSEALLAAIARRAAGPARAPSRHLRWPRLALSFAGAAILLIGTGAGTWLLLRPPAQQTYDFTELAMKLDAVEDDMEALSPESANDSFVEADLAEMDAELAMLAPETHSRGGELDSLEEEIEELAELSGGIF